jgi:hypothetical protein
MADASVDGDAQGVERCKRDGCGMPGCQLGESGIELLHSLIGARTAPPSPMALERGHRLGSPGEGCAVMSVS